MRRKPGTAGKHQLSRISLQNRFLVKTTSNTSLCNHFALAVGEGRFAISDGHNPSKNNLSHFEFVFDFNNNPVVYWANKFFHKKYFQDNPAFPPMLLTQSQSGKAPVMRNYTS